MPTFKLSALTMWRELPWAAKFAITAVAAIVILLALAWALTGFGGLGLDTTATVGAMLGIVFTIGLAVALMTLVFYSNRSDMDNVVSDAGKPGVQAGEDGLSNDAAVQASSPPGAS
jgi:uncharacterized RDD family membrane protein YckC